MPSSREPCNATDITSAYSEVEHMYEEELRPVEFVMLDVALSGTAYRRSPAGIGQ